MFANISPSHSKKKSVRFEEPPNSSDSENSRSDSNEYNGPD